MGITSWLTGLSIKHRVIVTSVCTSAITLVIASALIIFSNYTADKKRLVQSVHMLEDLINYNAGAALAFHDKAAAERILSMLAPLPHIIEAAIVANDGELYGVYKSSNPKHLNYQSSNEQHYSTPHQDRTDKFRSTRNFLESVAPVMFDQKPQGLIAIRVDLTLIKERSIFLIFTVLTGLILSLLLVYLLSKIFEKSVTAPINDLATAFREVSSSQDYSRRVESATNDEIGELANGFNLMLQAVEGRDAELKNLVQDLKAATAAKSAFLANMSHEIRTPLNGILGITSLLTQLPQDEKQRIYNKTIDDSAKALLQIINDILDLSRIEAGKYELQISDFDLEEVLLHIGRVFETISKEKDLSFNLHIAKGTPSLLTGDSRRLTQVLINLVGNALKFTAKGSVSVNVSAKKVSDSTASVLFEVSDTGIGIPLDAQKTIFDDFSQVDDSITRRFGGTGLGLSVSSKIVELLGGEIGVRSAEGSGSHFWFRLPLKLQSKEKFPATGTKSAINHSEESGADTSCEAEKKQYQGRVLIADDSDVNQFIMIETMKSFGLEACAVGGGEAAIETAKGEPFDLIIMDIHMPDIDGIEAARRIRDWEKINADNEPTPIVAFSASAMSGDRERFLNAGMDDYLSKPMQIDSLEKLLETWLGQQD